MQVRLLGFQFSIVDSSLDLDSFAEYTRSKFGEAHELGEHARYLFINSAHDEKYHVGLLVTVKDQKTYCELVQNGKKLSIKVNELDAASNIMDFNFFVINKKNGLGLYQYYHQSCSLNSFGYYSSQRFSDHRSAKIDSELDALSEGKKTAAKERAVRQKYRGRLKWEILVRKEKLKELIEELVRVKSFEYSFLSLTTEEPEFKPLSNFVRKESKKIAFVTGSPVERIAGSVSRFVGKADISGGKVTGVDAEGLDRVLRITDNPDNFGEYSYDEIAPKINSMDIDSFEKSWVVEELLAKCLENKHIFEAIPK